MNLKEKSKKVNLGDKDTEEEKEEKSKFWTMSDRSGG